MTNISFTPGRIFRRYNRLVILNISGLALGLAGIIFIAIWVSHELSYDKFFRNADRIYRVESLINFTGDPSVWSITPAPVAKSLLIDFPEVEDAVVLQRGYQRAIKVENQLFTAENLYYTNHSYFNIFSTDLISGDRSQLLTGPDEIIISRRIAGILFGNSDPIGKTVLFDNTDLLTVTGVIENSPTNTHLKVDYLVPFSLLEKEGNALDSWGRIDFITYVLLKEKTDAGQFNTKLSGYWQSKLKNFSGTLFINPLERLYLYRDPGFGSVKYPYSDKGPITRVILFAVIGIVLLLISSINFINLSTAFASQRAKEIAIRKVNGAGKSNLVMQLFGESLLQTFLATIAGLVVVVLLLPLFVKVSGVEFSIQSLFSIRNIIICLSLALLTGLISGMYPALILSSFKPSWILRPVPGNVVQGSGLRKILVVVQFGLAIIFIFSILVINRQITHMQKVNLGFDKEKVMMMHPHISPEKVDALAEQLEKIPGVSMVALGGNVPVNMGNFTTINKWDGNITGKPLMFFLMQVDDKYLDLFKIQIMEGRKFFKGTVGYEVIVNETAVRKMEMTDPIGKIIWHGNERYTITGIVKDFHFHSLREEIKPVFIFKSKTWWTKRIFVKLEPGNQFKTTGDIVDVVKTYSPDFPVNYMFIDQEIDKYYDNEKRLSILMNAATFLTVIISCIGLFSLTAFTVSRKSKEIGVRKAYGASISSVLVLLQKDFGRLVVISSFIAMPAGYYLMKSWLSTYTSHLMLSPVYFVVSILIIIIISGITLIFHTLKASRLNPAITLKND
jgi:ABC-type antimicrobial peptide transport system permease subunit